MGKAKGTSAKGRASKKGRRRNSRTRRSRRPRSGAKPNARRLIAQTPEPLVEGAQLTSNIETPAIAESSHVPALLFVVLALFIGYLFFRCVKTRRTKSFAYPLGLLGRETEAKPS